MSWKATAWAKEVKTGSPALKALLMILADYAHPETNSCFPGQEILAEHTEQSVRTVARQLKVLEDRKLIRRERRNTKDGHRTSDRYVLLLGPTGQSVTLAPTGQNDQGLPDTAVAEEPQGEPLVRGEGDPADEMESEEEIEADYLTKEIIDGLGFTLTAPQRFSVTQRLLAVPAAHRLEVAMEVASQPPPKKVRSAAALIKARIDEQAKAQQ